MQALSELTGWKLQAESVEGRGSERDRLRERLVTSFNAGRPVLVYPPHWNMALAYGYEDEGRTLLVRDYLKGDEPLRLPVDQLQPLQIYLHAYRDPPRLRECLLRALRAALCNHRRERGDGGLRGREYWYGRAALRAWIGDLRDADHYPEKTQQALFHLACFNLASLRDARRSAVSFLRDWCTVLDGRSPEALRRAAGLYEKETKALQPLLADRKPGEADGKETLDEWFARGRLREAAALAEALQLESAAMAEIEAALAR
jgi:hypothetical protein